MTRDRKVKIAIGQMKVAQGDTHGNLQKMISIILEASANKADLVCLPELAYTGYFLESKELQQLAEPVDGPFVQTLSKLAQEKGVYVIAGYAESVDIPGRMYNSAVLIDNKGCVVGNMRKVYAWGQEKLKFREGREFPVYDTPLGKIGMMICYDVEFPEPARVEALKGAEIIVVPAVWSIPAERRWDVDLSGNALFNILFMVGANPVGDNCCGKSQIVGPDGVVRACASHDNEEILYCEVDLNEVVATRSWLPYLNDFKEDTFSMDAVNKY